MSTTVAPLERLQRSPTRRVRRLLLAIELVVAANAVGGAVYGLAGAENVPREWLEGTPFESYFVPSLVLLIGVGGGMSVAAAALVGGWRLAPQLTVVAGLVLVGWIAVQVVVIVPDGGFSVLQPVMFASGLLVTALGWHLRTAEVAARRTTRKRER